MSEGHSPGAGQPESTKPLHAAFISYSNEDKAVADAVCSDGEWDGESLRAVTNDVISKPANIEWTPESFTLRFTEDGKRGAFECNSGGHLYEAQLFPP